MTAYPSLPSRMHHMKKVKIMDPVSIIHPKMVTQEVKERVSGGQRMSLITESKEEIRLVRAHRGLQVDGITQQTSKTPYRQAVDLQRKVGRRRKTRKIDGRGLKMHIRCPRNRQRERSRSERRASPPLAIRVCTQTIRPNSRKTPRVDCMGIGERGKRKQTVGRRRSRMCSVTNSESIWHSAIHGRLSLLRLVSGVSFPARFYLSK